MESVAQIEYREHPDFPGYRVGSDGTIWSRWKKGGRINREGLRDEWKPIRPGPSGKRHYLAVFLKWRGNRRQVSIKVHRLVLECFVGVRPHKWEGRHLDGNINNNSLTNVCWGTCEENAADRRRHRTQQSKITADQAREVLKLANEAKLSQPQIAAMFGITQTAVSLIKRRKNWKHIA